MEQLQVFKRKPSLRFDTLNAKENANEIEYIVTFSKYFATLNYYFNVFLNLIDELIKKIQNDYAFVRHNGKNPAHCGHAFSFLQFIFICWTHSRSPWQLQCLKSQGTYKVSPTLFPILKSLLLFKKSFSKSHLESNSWSYYNAKLSI